MSSIPLTNADASVAVIGAPVYAAGNNTFDFARANSQPQATVIGLVKDASIAPAASGNVQTDDVFTATTAQWDAVVNGESGGLTPGAAYYLDPANVGKLTPTPPSSLGQYFVKVGTALSPTELDLQIGPTILLGAPSGTNGNAGPSGPTGPVSPANLAQVLSTGGSGGGGSISDVASFAVKAGGTISNEAMSINADGSMGLGASKDAGSMAVGGSTHATYSSQAIGQGSTANDSSIALGIDASADSVSKAVGNAAHASNYSEAVGPAAVSDQHSIAVGNGSNAQDLSVALGSMLTGPSTWVPGPVGAPDFNGYDPTYSVSGPPAPGGAGNGYWELQGGENWSYRWDGAGGAWLDTSSSGSSGPVANMQSVACGSNATAQTQSVAVGNATTGTNGSVAVGNQATATDGSLALGYRTSAASGSMAIGSPLPKVTSGYDGGTFTGAPNVATTGGTAIGLGVVADNSCTAIGFQANAAAPATDSLTIGFRASVTGTDTVAITNYSGAGNNSTLISCNDSACGDNSLAIGPQPYVGDYCIGIGLSSQYVNGDHSVGIASQCASQGAALPGLSASGDPGFCNGVVIGDTATSILGGSLGTESVNIMGSTGYDGNYEGTITGATAIFGSVGTSYGGTGGNCSMAVGSSVGLDSQIQLFGPADKTTHLRDTGWGNPFEIFDGVNATYLNNSLILSGTLEITSTAAGFNHVQLTTRNDPNVVMQAAGSAALLSAVPAAATGDLWVDTTAGGHDNVLKVW